MGAGSSKKAVQPIQPQPPRLAPIIEAKPPSPSLPRSPEVETVTIRRESIASRVSTKQSVRNQTSGNNRRTPFGDLNNNNNNNNISRQTIVDSPLPAVDTPLPAVETPIKKSSSRSSTRASSVIRPPPINHSRLDTHSPSTTSHKSFERKHSETSHRQAGRCSRCPHCQRMGYHNHSSTSTPKPNWLTQNPINDEVHIDMDEYDVEAVKKKIISKNGHLLGAYDYQPYLTIEQTDLDTKKENYYTQPFVAKMKPRVLPATTPFPDFELLQRREQRLNKPYTLTLFDD